MIGFDDPALRAARLKWQYRGTTRPEFAEAPGPGQRSVWDFSRPPRIAPDSREVQVRWRDKPIATSRRALTVCETAGPPTWYLPLDDVDRDRLHAVDGQSVCEWKGVASYFDVIEGGARLARAAWTYPEPFPGAETLTRHVAFYPHQLECRVAGELVLPQPGNLYAGWVTRDLTGPLKGAPGTEWW